jgi:spore germination protein
MQKCISFFNGKEAFMKKETPVSVHIQDNYRYLQKQCEGCADILIRRMKLGEEKKISCIVVYIEVAVSNMTLQDSVIGKLINKLWTVPDQEMHDFLRNNSLGISDVKQMDTMEEAMKAMLAGNAVLFVDGFEKGIKIASKGYPGMGVMKAESEKVLRGSNEGFSDSVKINTALIRKRVRSTGMKVKETPIGVRTDTMTALVYMEDLVYPELLKEIEKRLGEFEIDGILESGMLEQLTEEKWSSLFPQFQTTERPDRAAMEVLNGRVILICDNSPVALILPTTFNSFLQVSEDRYNRFGIVSFQRMLRYLAAFLALLLSGTYLAVIRFHTQILPTNLLLSFAEARQGVPFSSLIEVIFMELSFELIREAGVRMPGPLGGTIGIVGGLIIGDAAVSANLVSPMSVVVVAMSALCSFAIPNEDFSAPFRLLKFGFIILGGNLGILGIGLGLYWLTGHLAGLTSFKIPYLMPFVGADLTGYHDERDSLIRAPFRLLRRRPVFSRREQRIRLKEEKNRVR